MAALVLIVLAVLQPPSGPDLLAAEVFEGKGEVQILPLLDGTEIRLSFNAPADRLSGLELEWATYQRINHVQVFFSLKDVASDQVVRQGSLAGEKIKDWGLANFRFQPIPSSAGRLYELTITSPGASPVNCVGLPAYPLEGAGTKSFSLNGQEMALYPRLKVWAAISLPWWNSWLAWLAGLSLGAAFLLLPRPKRRECGLGLLLIAASLILVLVVLEAAVRIHQGRLLNFENFLWQEANTLKSAYPCRYDRLLGYAPRVQTAAPSPFGPITILPPGLRSNGHSSKDLPSRPVILCVGDSFTFGDQVADDQTWPAYLEEIIGCRAANGGVFGYGLDQIVLRAEELTPILKPDLLIVSLIEDDINRCELSMRTGWPKPYFEPDGEGLVLRNVPVPRPPGQKEVFRRLGGYSLLVHLMMTRINPEYWLYGLEDAAHRGLRAHDQGFEVACRLMSRLAELKERRDLKAIILFQYTKDLERDLFRRLAGCVVQNNLELVDLYQPLKKIRLENHQEYEAIFTQGHMRPPGNRFVAEVLAQVLIPVLSEPRSGEEAI